MSQVNVERVIGLLATDEALRRRYTQDPFDALQGIVQAGVRLSECEFQALASIDPGPLAQFAEAIDPRLQKTDLRGCAQ